MPLRPESWLGADWHAIGTSALHLLGLRGKEPTALRMDTQEGWMLRHIRFHGRGGEGVKLASRIVSRTAFLSGFVVQDSPVYGAERRGAPVVVFARFSNGPIYERGYIDDPDMVVVMDESLLLAPDAAVLSGVDESTVVAVNSRRGAADLQARTSIPGRVVAFDVSSIALEVLHQYVLSAPIAGASVKVAAIAGWEVLQEAVRIELGELGLAADVVERNLHATRRVFDAAPMLGLGGRRRVVDSRPAEAFTIQRLPPRVASPSVSVPGTSALRSTDGWRVYRPEIDRLRCSRCFMCFALCPEGAIHLDGEEYPVVDYHHCKGCLVCASECPPKAIDEVREAAA